MARVSYVEPATAPAEVQAVYAEVEGIAGTVLNPFRAIAHSPQLLERWWRLLWACMTELELDPRLRELVLLRIFQLTGCDYCFAEHARIARRLGVPQEQIDGVDRYADQAAFTDLDRLALRYAETITRENRVEEDVAAALRSRLGERGLVELTFCIGNWNGLARVVVPLGIDPESAEAR
jgi:AhpD family alkylhydroperoxidase